MDKKNLIVQASIELVKNILFDFPPHESWQVINLSLVKPDEKRKRHVFKFPYDDIPSAYLYKHKEVIKFLTLAGVLRFPVFNIGWSYGYLRHLPISHRCRDTMEKYMNRMDEGAFGITKYLSDKKYIDKNERIAIFLRKIVQKKPQRDGSVYHAELPDEGPTLSGQHYALLMKNDAKQFLRFVNGQDLVFKDGIIKFLGQELEIKGEIKIARTELLIKNVNSIISKKEFYEVNDQDNYSALEEKKKITQVNNSLNKMFYSIRDDIYKNKILKKALIFSINDGYGVFVNQKSLVPHHNINWDDYLDDDKDFIFSMNEDYVSGGVYTEVPKNKKELDNEIHENNKLFKQESKKIRQNKKSSNFISKLFLNLLKK